MSVNLGVVHKKTKMISLKVTIIEHDKFVNWTYMYTTDLTWADIVHSYIIGITAI